MVAGVARFAEKPSLEEARDLVADGALWNLFILGGTVRSMLELFCSDYAEAVVAMREALAQDGRGGTQSALYAFYASRETLDFSRHILERQAAGLRVIRVPACGWTDLGTPHRVASAVRDIALRSTKGSGAPDSAPLFLDLGRLACTG